MAGFGIDLEHCDPEIREAFFEAVLRESQHLRRVGERDRHAARIATLKRMVRVG